MSKVKIDIEHMAKLANLPISKEEKQKFEKQLSDILNYIEKLNELETKDTEPTSQVTGLENIMRDDETRPCLSQEEALENTKYRQNGFFKVSAILDYES